jgi:hypothetical protein
MPKKYIVTVEDNTEKIIRELSRLTGHKPRIILESVLQNGLRTNLTRLIGSDKVEELLKNEVSFNEVEL